MEEVAVDEVLDNVAAVVLQEAGRGLEAREDAAVGGLDIHEAAVPPELRDLGDVALDPSAHALRPVEHRRPRHVALLLAGWHPHAAPDMVCLDGGVCARLSCHCGTRAGWGSISCQGSVREALPCPELLS